METQETFDTAKLMSVFPTELWLIILNHVDNYADYLRICGSSTFLKSTLQTLRTTVLFPDVIQVLRQWINHDNTGIPYPITNTLLPLRLVCTSGKNGVDKVLPYVGDPLSSRLTPILSKAINFAKYKEPFSGNPFLSRAVCFEPSLDDLSTYYAELLQMLKNFGRHIWYCEIYACIGSTEENLITLSHRLPTILKLMPNLHMLNFLSFNQLSAKPLLPENNFPVLKHLTAVEQRRMPSLVFQQLVQRNPQIISVSSTFPTSPEHISVLLKEMPNLQDLFIDLNVIGHFNQFRDCGQVACRLTKLTICVSSINVSWESVLFAVESYFGGTLQDLCIDLPNPKFYTDGCSLNCPNLKTLSLYMEHPANLDFILPTKQNLEKFYICCPERENSQEQKSAGILKVFERWTNLYNSNIWELFSKLKCLRIVGYMGTYECNRHLYEHKKFSSQ